MKEIQSLIARRNYLIETRNKFYWALVNATDNGKFKIGIYCSVAMSEFNKMIEEIEKKM